MWNPVPPPQTQCVFTPKWRQSFCRVGFSGDMHEAGRSCEWHHLEVAPLLHEQEVYKRSWRRTRSCTVIDICSVRVWTRNRESMFILPHAGHDSSPPEHKSFNMSLLTCFVITVIMERESSGSRHCEAMSAFQRPYWDLCYSPFIFVLGSSLIHLLLLLTSVKGDSGVLICRYPNLANEPVLLVWIWSLSLNNGSENREQQVCTYVKRNSVLLLNLFIQAETLPDALLWW